jgi:2-desacetyl-2-hydroxyethyl bacteriochlorophyllide A dehydrogenase
MRAVTLEPRKPGSLKLEEIPEPGRTPDSLLVRTRAIGVCGTDRELIDGHYGEAPPGRRRLVLGHESLGRVVDAPPQSGFAIGDSVVGIVRLPDPVPCANCAIGEWDMCTNGGYTERGIKGADGFCADFFTLKSESAVRVDASLDLAAVLLEPASVLAKAWEHIEHIARRALSRAGRLLVTGAGPVGLLAALMGVQRGFAVHVQDHNERGVKPALVNSLGARYSVAAPKDDFDVIIECTGRPAIIKQVLGAQTPKRIVCLAGLSGTASDTGLDVAAFNQSMVLGNGVVFGTVNANRRHYEAAAAALARAERSWLERLITRRVPLKKWEEAYEKRSGDVKTVMLFED